MRPLCFHRHVWGRRGPRRPQINRPTSVNPAPITEEMAKYKQLLSPFSQPFLLDPGPLSSAGSGAPDKMSLAHSFEFALSLFFNLMRGCGESCQCDNNYRNSPAATGPGPQNIHTHNCEVMEKQKKKKGGLLYLGRLPDAEYWVTLIRRQQRESNNSSYDCSSL